MITVRQFKQLKFKSKKNPLEAEEIIGKNLFDAIKNNFYISNKNIVVLCGNTNKGHLGFVLARYFREEANVNVIFLNKKENLDEDFKINYLRILGNLKQDTSLVYNADIIVDAILDNEVRGFIREPAKSAIIKYNNSKAFKIAIDYPSGLNPDTGIAVDIETKNNLIFTLQDMKKGLLQYKNVVVVDTGLK
ncbi:NAD(P)H-hydrate epimerase [Candidatus Woesearchaeota archaeon]|nr:NAD(P)H-hydrate epimerase [Candidatus Woesearchaeota archaeon]